MEIPCARDKRLQAEMEEIFPQQREDKCQTKPTIKKLPPGCPEPKEEPKKKNYEHVRLIDQKDRKQPPVLLTKQRYAKIYANATNAKEVQMMVDRMREEEYRQYLKEGSDELVKNFGGNFKRTQEQKLAELRLAAAEKDKDYQTAFKEYHEKVAKEREEKILKANKILERMKPGPRDLRGAIVESEVMQARHHQIAIKENYQKAIKKQEEIDMNLCVAQKNAFIGEDAEQKAEQCRNLNAYKTELKQTIDENHRLAMERRRQDLKEAIAEREALNCTVRKEIEREKAAMCRKMEFNRRNALEAMKMAEQRRLRDSMTDNIENRVNCVFNTGQYQLKKMMQNHAQQLREEKERIHDETVLRIVGMRKEDPRAKEEERLQRDISYYRLKFTAEEEQKMEKVRAAKRARIEEHLREVERQKMLQALTDEQRRFEMAERFKNEEVNLQFKAEMDAKQAQRFNGIREGLDKQIVEIRNYNRMREEASTGDCLTDLRYLKDDLRFFEAAADLMEDARKKGRTLHPFIRLINQYKRENNIQVKPTLPKHMVTNITIGLDEPKCKRQDKTSDVPCASERQRDEEAIEKSIARIEKIIAEDAADKKKPCPKYCPIECKRHQVRTDGLVNPEPTPSERLRYSVWELKQLNQYENAGECVNQPQHVLV